MTTDDGIIDVERNPFAIPSWVKQGYRFTTTRATRLKPLLGLTVSEIKSMGDDKFANYPAFVGIRWGYAEIVNDTLLGTKKWDIEKDELLEEKDKKPSTNSKPQSKKEKTPPKPTGLVTPSASLEEVRQELERRRKVLIERAHDSSIPMDRVEREHIIEYLEKENLPQKPDTEAQLLKEFVSSALSMNQAPYRTRSKLKKVLGEIALGSSIAKCLSKMYECDEFLSDENWATEKLGLLAARLKEKEHDKFRWYVLNTAEKVAQVMQRELAKGLDEFYERVESETKTSPLQAWKFMERFTKEIPYVGPGLMSDFLKNSGYPYFVKIDVHLKKEFPTLLPVASNDAKTLFIHAWHLCEELGMTPFIFDHIMYQWGRAKQ